MWSDLELQSYVVKELDWDPAIHASQIGASVRDGEVHLVGHVDSYWEKCAASEASWRVAQVRAVRNEIRVELPFSSLRDDDDIALAAMSILEWNCLVPETVAVQADAGCIILNGTVAWQSQKAEAERALCSMRGIKEIRNQIQVSPSMPLGDAKHQIEDALKRSALVNAAYIKVHVSHGTIGLHGHAHSHAEKAEALLSAWRTPGIEKLEDQISISAPRGG